MKKFAILILLMVPFMTKATTYTSIAAGGPWNAAATWGGAGFPHLSTDVAVIANGATVTITMPATTGSVSILSSSTLAFSGTSTLTVFGNFANSGTFSAATGSTVSFVGSSSETIGTVVGAPIAFYNLTVAPSLGTVIVSLAQAITVSGALAINTGTFNCAQYAVTGGGSLNMANSTTMVVGSPSAAINTPFPSGYNASNTTFSSSSTVIYEAGTNQTISTSPPYANLEMTTACSPAGTPTTLYVAGNFLDNGGFTASAGAVVFNGSSAQTLGGFSPSTFYDLTIAPSPATNTVTLGNNETVSDNLTISTGTLDVSSSNYRLTIGNNFTNNSAFTCRSGTVSMDGGANQTISASSGGLTFYNLRDSQAAQTDQMILANAITVTDLGITGGTLNCQTYQITGNASGVMTMANGASLWLGSPSSGTPVAFPRFFTSSNTTLDTNSTVTYQTFASTFQTVSDTPTYGNLILATSNSVPAGSPLNVEGSLTINSLTTLGGSVTTGTLNLGGNLTNNGTFTPGTGGTVVFNGLGTKAIGGGAIITFNNLTISGTSGGTLQLGYPTTISNNLTITSGILDVTSAHSYSLTIGSNFTESGGALNPQAGTVFMNGSGSQTLGGSATIQLYALQIGNTNSPSVTLGGNITAASNILIHTGATFTAAGYNINIAGNFTDNGTFNCNTSTFDFDNNGNQCVSGTHTSETFKNLTIGSLSKLGTSCTVDIDGTIFIQPGGQMLCACH